MGTICSHPGRYIYFRENYNLIVILQYHYASLIFEFSIKLFSKLLNRDKVVTAISDQKADEFWNFHLEWDNLFDALAHKKFIATDFQVLRNKIDNELVCKSIPEMSLNKDYVSNWNTWNKNELPHQIIRGVDSKVKQCYDKKKSQHLKEKYDELRNYYITKYDQEWNSII